MTLTSQRFQAIVAAYGCEPQRWPEAERAAAQAFLADDSRAPTWLEAERGLDAMLDLLAVSEASEAPADIHARVMSRVAVTAVVPVLPMLAVRRVMWAGLGLVACMAGVVTGVDYTLSGLSELRAQAVLEQTAMIDME